MQGALWDVNSYDQWGVELGKVLSKKIEHPVRTARPAKAEMHVLEQGKARRAWAGGMTNSNGRNLVAFRVDAAGLEMPEYRG